MAISELRPRGFRAPDIAAQRFGAFDYVYHSGYRRTQETAEHLLAAYPQAERDAMRMRHHLFLRERDAGVHEQPRQRNVGAGRGV